MLTYYQMFVTRDSEGMMFRYEGLVPHIQFIAGALLVKSSCSSYVWRTHDVIDDVSRSQSGSNFEIAIPPSIFQLERRSKAQNILNAHGNLVGIFKFRYHFWWKKYSATSKWRPFWKFWKWKFYILIQISLKLVPKCLIDNNPALVQRKARRRTGNNPLSEPMLTRFTDTYVRH